MSNEDVILKESELEDYLLWRSLNEKVETWRDRVKKEPRLIRKDIERKSKFNFIANLKTQIGCYSCKEDNFRALDLHHANRQEKTFNLSECYLFSWEEILNELKKCKVICCNCHRKGG